MDSGNSGSISSSGDEEYDSRTLLPSSFLNQPPQFGSLLPPTHHHHNQPSFFDLSSTYLHALSQPQQNSFLNLETGTSQTRRSEPDCSTAGASSLPPAPSSSALLPTQVLVGHVDTTDPSLQLRSVHDDPHNAKFVASQTTSPRNPKKRTRASRRAPTTVLTTDTSNFRAMVQEFTGIPAPPFSGSSYSRRLDLLTGSSSLRSSSSHLDTTSSFYPLLRPSPHKLHHHHHENPLLFPSSSSLMHNNNMIDANAIGLGSATNNSSSNSSINYQQQQLPPDLGLPYHNNNNMLSMQNHLILSFQPSSQPLHAFDIGGFGAKSQAGLSVQSLQDLGVNAQLVATEGGGDGGGRRDPLMSLDGSYGGGGGGKDDSGGGGGGGGKLNFSGGGGGSSTLNNDKTLENNSGRGEGTAVDSWICSSD